MSGNFASEKHVSQYSDEFSTSSHTTYTDSQTSQPVPDSYSISSFNPNNTDELDPTYKIHSSSQFRFGRVFKVLWQEPAGAHTVSETSSENGSLILKSYCAIRRFVIVNASKGHCICVPISTYGGQATKKSGVDARTHAIIFTSDNPVLLPGETSGGLLRPPIRVIPDTRRSKLSEASRLNYGKVYTVEHNVKVEFVGRIHQDYLNIFLENYTEVNFSKLLIGPPSTSSLRVESDDVSCQDTNYPGQYQTRVLHSDFRPAGRGLLRKGRVFAAPFPEAAEPTAADTKEISLDSFGNKIHTKVRRFLVVRDMPSHATCVPINTYGGREKKRTAKEQDRYQLFPVGEEKTPDLSMISLKVQEGLLPLVNESKGEIDVNYSHASVDFTRLYTIPHYILAKKIGRIHTIGLPFLDKCLYNALGVFKALEEENTSVSLVSESDGKWAPLSDSVDYEDQQHSTASVEQEYPTMINSFAGYGYQPQPNDFAEQYPGAFAASAGHEHQSQPNNSGGQGQEQYLAVSTSFAGYGQQPQSNNFARQYPGAFTASTGHGYQSQPNN